MTEHHQLSIISLFGSQGSHKHEPSQEVHILIVFPPVYVSFEDIYYKLFAY